MAQTRLDIPAYTQNNVRLMLFTYRGQHLESIKKTLKTIRIVLSEYDPDSDESKTPYYESFGYKKSIQLRHVSFATQYTVYIFTHIMGEIAPTTLEICNMVASLSCGLSTTMDIMSTAVVAFNTIKDAVVYYNLNHLYDVNNVGCCASRKHYVSKQVKLIKQLRNEEHTSVISANNYIPRTISDSTIICAYSLFSTAFD